MGEIGKHNRQHCLRMATKFAPLRIEMYQQYKISSKFSCQYIYTKANQPIHVRGFATQPVTSLSPIITMIATDLLT